MVMIIEIVWILPYSLPTQQPQLLPEEERI
jgi:hypothetical protein